MPIRVGSQKAVLGSQFIDQLAHLDELALDV
jgi:hypothetical protein